jgi:menaquinone-specific isochorismate synthase
LAVHTVEIPDPGDLIAALPEQGISWVRRGDGMVAWGEVARHNTWGPARMDEALLWWRRITRHAVVRDDVRARGTGLVAFGSFSFADDSPSGGTLIVPRYVLGRVDGRSFFTVVGDAATPPTSLADALAGATPVSPLPSVTVDGGDEGRWTAAVAAAVARIGAGEVDKVVLARAVEARAAGPVDVRSVLANLATDYDMCWTFHVDGMVGATPELLARVDHGLVTSRVLAGTIRMTGDDMGDLARAAQLARSSKDREEHSYAVRSVMRVLADHCASVNVPDEPSVLHLPNVMHLATDITGALSTPVGVLDLVRELHPSAAVCGTPTLAAARVIDELEGLDRARYAGPVGWVDAAGEGEWCIALRSAELSRADASVLRLFAGCGIVAASDPASEWAESEAKLEPMRAALRPGLD